MSFFLMITIVALLAVFSVDVREKRREHLKKEQSANQDFFEGISHPLKASSRGKAS